MNILGISAGYHDAAAAIVNHHGDILFAGHAERYSKIKNDANFDKGLRAEIEQYDIGHIAYYETPWKKQLRRLYSGEGIQWNSLTTEQCIRRQLGSTFTQLEDNNVIDEIHAWRQVGISSYNHHLNHRLPIERKAEA